MLCRKPFMRDGVGYGCGQCMPCRFNRRRLWTHRIMLEALVHARASFVTLTYRTEDMPDGGTLCPLDLQLWLKRFRKRAGACRYFGVGEYGDISWRPHYHLALFGHGREAADMVACTWGKGHTYVGDLTCASACYVSGYVTKKMTRKDDARLQGRYPEFARMSLRPGVGAIAADQLAEALQCRAGWDEIDRRGDVPNVLRHGAKSMPLGRYLSARLRVGMSFVEGGRQPEEVFRGRSAEMRALYDAYCMVEKAAGRFAAGRKDWLVAESKQKALILEKRMKIREQWRKL